MKKTLKKILLVYLLGSAALLTAQSDPISRYFDGVQSGRRILLPRTEMSKVYSDTSLLVQLKPYLENKETVKEALSFAGRVGSRHLSAPIRQQIVEMLIDSSFQNSKYAGIAADYLQDYNRSDFSDKALTLLDKLLKSHPPEMKAFVLLAGFTGRSDVLTELLPEYQDNKRLAHYFRLALSRCGMEQYTRSIVNTTSAMTIDDRFVYQVAPMLVYTRQKAVFDLLLTAIMDDTPNCIPAGEHKRGKVGCGLRLLTLVAPYIQDFPITVSRSGVLQTDNPEQSLREARQWIQQHPSNYQLISEKF